MNNYDETSGFWSSNFSFLLKKNEKYMTNQTLPCASSLCNESFLLSSSVACAAATEYCTTCSTKGFLDSLKFEINYSKYLNDTLK